MKDLIWRGMEDHDYVLRVAKQFEIARTEGALVRYRLHVSNVSKKNSFLQFNGLKSAIGGKERIAGQSRLSFSIWVLYRPC